MREIKFRAWDSRNSTMISPEKLGMDGGFIEPSGKGLFVLDHLVIHGPVTCERNDVYETKGRIEGAFLAPWSMPATEVEFMQYTGLRDTNSSEVYESDICRFFDDGQEIIAWIRYYAGEWLLDERMPGAKTVNRKIYTLSGAFQHAYSKTGDHPVEVIGNVYENGDLLND